MNTPTKDQLLEGIEREAQGAERAAVAAESYGWDQDAEAWRLVARRLRDLASGNFARLGYLDEPADEEATDG